jgi:hypothetical protein
VPKRAKRATVETFTLEAFLETPEAYWERIRQQPAAEGDGHELAPLTPEDRDALLQWRSAAIADGLEAAPTSLAEKQGVRPASPRMHGGPYYYYYAQAYCVVVAWRFIQESGTTLASVAAWEWGSWDMSGEFLARPSGPGPLLRADGTPATAWDEWLAARNAAGWGEDHFSTLLTGLRIIAFRVARQELAEAKARQDSPPLRLPSRAYKTYVPNGTKWLGSLATLRQQGRLTAKELELWRDKRPVRLAAEELLVVAGLLDIARRHGTLRQYTPARAKVGDYSFDIRLGVDMPKLEEFGRLLGYRPNEHGRITRDARRNIEEAFESLTKGVRPIVVETVTREGRGRGAKVTRSFEVVEDVPIRRTTGADGVRRLELHPTLADGYWWGHLTLDRLPQQWARTREALGIAKLSPAMKDADLYFRWLAIGLSASEYRRAGGAPGPDHLEKKLAVKPLLERLNLEETRRQKGPTETARILGQTIEFAKECGSVLAWRWEGTGKLPAHVVVTMPAAMADVDPERVAVQEELFPELAEDSEEGPLELAEAGTLGDAEWELEA